MLLYGDQNLLKAVEFAGKAGIIGIEYLATPGLEPEQYENFLDFNVLRREYLNQTFNFVPGLQVEYEDQLSKNLFETNQDNIANIDDIERSVSNSVEYLVNQIR